MRKLVVIVTFVLFAINRNNEIEAYKPVSIANENKENYFRNLTIKSPVELWKKKFRRVNFDYFFSKN